MKFTKLILSAFAVVGILASCSKSSEDLGTPSLTLSSSELTFEKATASQEIQVNATRDWKATSDADWVAITPASGNGSKDAQKVTITVLDNLGLDRTASVKFDIGFDTKTLTVNQAGTGSASDAIMYHNDFDKEAATQTYGTSNTSWPYLDQSDCWKNQSGKGITAVDYAFNGMSARNNSASNGTYSDYTGSGTNNLLFGTNGYFEVKNIALSGSVNYTLSFGTEKYLNAAPDNTFVPSEFHVYVSNDGAKWVELTYTFPSGFKSGRWDIASSTFTVPVGTSTLYLYFKSDLTSGHRIDDVDLSIANVAGTAIDFSKGVEIGGGTGGDTVKSGTITEIIAMADATKIKTENALVAAKGTASFVATDGTSNILVYGSTSAAAVKVGDKVTIEATKTTYGSIPELSTPTVTVSSSGNAVTYPAVKDITSTFDTYTSTAVEYISYKGTLSVTTSGTKTYYNVTVAGATSKTGSISSPSDDLGIAAMNGQVITITGYFAGFSSTGDKYINILPTAVKADANAKIFNVSPLTLSTAASETSVSFNITSNVDWKASSDNAAFTLDKASGNGDATVTVSFAANTAATSNTAKITVSTEADVTTKSYTVEITQAGLSTEDYSSNVTWTLGTKAYNESATVNGTGSVAILKLGTSSLAGDATLSVPAGKSKIIFYAYAWNGKTCTLTLTMNGSTLTTLSLNPNSGCANTSPYTITSASTDKYSIPLGTVLSAATDITLSTSTATGTRAVLFAIKAE
jgi:hypothetical protein